MPFLTRTHALFDAIHVKKGTPASYLMLCICFMSSLCNIGGMVL